MSDGSLSGFHMRGTTEDAEALSFALPAMESAMLIESGPKLAGPGLSVRPVLQFDPRSACEVILYIAAKLQEPTFHRIVKLLYFADKLHLERYGRFTTGDRYIAMEYGPVPSNIYDMLKAARNVNQTLPGSQERPFAVEDERRVVPLRAPDMDWISTSEVECLDEVIARYGSLSSEN